jgi:hypothetical protein
VVAGHPAADHSAAGDLLAPLGRRAASRRRGRPRSRVKL